MGAMERCVAKGPMVGVKLWVAKRCGPAEIDPLIRRAAELKAVIFQHTWYKTGGNYPGESTPMDLAELAARHPDTPLICGHTHRPSFPRLSQRVQARSPVPSWRSCSMSASSASSSS